MLFISVYIDPMNLDIIIFPIVLTVGAKSSAGQMTSSALLAQCCCFVMIAKMSASA
jgi:hypothetical protein